MKNWLKKGWHKFVAGMKKLWHELGDVRTIVIFAIVFIVLASPVWIGYLLFFITRNPVHTSYATAYLLFWNVIPCTPFILICLAITLGLKKLIFRVHLPKKKTKEIVPPPDDIKKN